MTRLLMLGLLAGALTACSGSGAGRPDSGNMDVEDGGSEQEGDVPGPEGDAPGPEGPLDARWLKVLGDVGSDRANDLAVDSNGNIVVVGSFEGSVDFGGETLSSTGEKDVFLLSLDSSGGLRWAVSFGGATDDAGLGVAVGVDDEVFVTGFVEGTVDFGDGPVDTNTIYGTDVFVARYSPDGLLRWANLYGNSYHNKGSAIAADPDGLVCAAGDFKGEIAFGDSLSLTAHRAITDGFLVCLDPDGSESWAKQISSAGSDEARSVVIDASRRIVVAGLAGGPTDFGGGTLDSPSFNGFIARYSQTGVFDRAWMVCAGTPSYCDASSVTTDADNNLLATGQFAGTVDLGTGSHTSAGMRDLYLALFREDGSTGWIRPLGTGELDEGAGVAFDPAGTAVLACSTWNMQIDGQTFDGVFLLAAFDLADASLVWGTSPGASSIGRRTTMVFTGPGVFYLAGTIGNTWQISDQIAVHKGSYDGVVGALSVKP